MSQPIQDFLARLRRTLAGKRYQEGLHGRQPGLEYLIVGTQDPLEGTILDGKYKILARLGAGGMSIVYKACHEAIDRVVAVKVLKQEWCNDPLTVKRFQREAKAISVLRHTNIMYVMDIGKTDTGQPYFVCEFLEGRSLEDRLSQENRLSSSRALPIFSQICDAMHHAHKHGLVHRDLKPGNIMLVHEVDRQEAVKLVDFGIVKLQDSMQAKTQTLTRKGEIWGSPSYMSPEQCLGKSLDGRSDIYSLGSVMYETFTGKPLFEGKNVPQILMKQISEAPVPISQAAPEVNLPPRLVSLIEKSLEKAPEKRFQSMEQVRDVIDSIIFEMNDNRELAHGVSENSIKIKLPETSTSQAGTTNRLQTQAQERIPETTNKDSTADFKSKSQPGDTKTIILVAVAALVFVLSGVFLLYQMASYLINSGKFGPYSHHGTRTATPDQAHRHDSLPDSGRTTGNSNPLQIEPKRAQQPAKNLSPAESQKQPPPAASASRKKLQAEKTSRTPRRSTPDLEVDESIYLRKKSRDSQGYWNDYQSKEAQSP